MGRRLSSWERSQREREREQRAAARRAKTAARRSKEKKIREKEQAKQKAAKEAKTADEIKNNRKIQKVFDRYLNDITSFHFGYNLKKFTGSYHARKRTRSYQENPVSISKNIQWKDYRKKAFKYFHFTWNDYKIKKYKTPQQSISDQGVLFKISALMGYSSATLPWIIFRATFLWFVWYFCLFLILPAFGWETRYRSQEEELAKAAMTYAAIIVFVWEGLGSFMSYITKQAENKLVEANLLNKKKYDKEEQKKLKKDQEKKAEAKAEYEEKRKIDLEKHNKEQQELLEKDQDAKAEAQIEHEEKNKAKIEQHKQKEKKNKTAFEINEIKRIEVLQKAEKGSIDDIEMIIESILPLEHTLNTPRNMPSETEIDKTEVGYNVLDSKTIHIIYELPDLDSVIPKHKYSITPKGTTLKISDMSDRQTNNLKNNFVCSMAFHHALELLRAYPFFETVIFEAQYTGVEPTTGKDKDITVLSIDIKTVKLLNEFNLDKIPEIEDAIINFDHKISKYGSKPKDIETNINKEELVWSIKNSKDEGIPYGLSPKQNKKQLPV